MTPAGRGASGEVAVEVQRRVDGLGGHGAGLLRADSLGPGTACRGEPAGALNPPASRLQRSQSEPRLGLGKGQPPHGAVAIKGRRPSMEDRLVVVPRLVECQGTACPVCREVVKATGDASAANACHFYAVYDGHGGGEAAHHCAQKLHRNLLGLMESEGCRVCGGGSEDGRWKSALERAYLQTDGELQQDSCTGTTAVAALLRSDKIVVANTGDSRAVLLRNGHARALSDDHKAGRADERARVEAAGGHVVSWNGVRVMGVLSMSRAVGDHFLRPFVIPDPEITVTARHAEDELLILASDGLWDMLSNQEACTIAKQTLVKAGAEARRSPKDAAQCAATRLVKAALNRGSADNISVIVVDLRQQRAI
mmetsp:Transcript_29666/g.82884  ORF Transcript_29666/g.82884 Transcript_29666/m.82884 type:complete len:367 (+) Transcript_29666:181-1281(+)